MCKLTKGLDSLCAALLLFLRRKTPKLHFQYRHTACKQAEAANLTHAKLEFLIPGGGPVLQ